jgi:DNA-binding PadR family transcriptional regulator
MRKLYPFGWIDRDLKELGFLRDMSSSAAKLYILYVLAGGAEGKSCYSIKALREATGLANATIYKARQELINMGLVTTQKEMVRGRRNKKPKVWVELQDLPVNTLQIKHRKPLVVESERKRMRQPQQIYTMPAWMQLGAERLRKKREGNV